MTVIISDGHDQHTIVPDLPEISSEYAEISSEYTEIHHNTIQDTRVPVSDSSKLNAQSVTDNQDSEIIISDTFESVTEYIDNDTETKILNDFLSISGYTADSSEQIITVRSEECSCHVCFFDKSEGIWSLKCETDGIVGKYGVSDKSMEGDYHTPKGKFSLGFAFGTEDMSGLSVEYKKISSNCYWVDDPESPLYNQWVETDDITWNSAEHMSDYPECYKYGIVINYNMDPIEKYRGSAIFLHCMRGAYTAGCVGIPDDTMLYILKNLDSEKNPCIMII